MRYFVLGASNTVLRRILIKINTGIRVRLIRGQVEKRAVLRVFGALGVRDVA